MGLSGKIGNIDKTKIYGVLPYVAPEVLSEKPYTQAADIYSFGMIMYFVATGKQPFANYAHDKILALKICNEIRPEIYEFEAPICYINLMKRCWDSNPNNRPNAIEISKLIFSFEELYEELYFRKNQQYYDMIKQFKEAEKYRILNLYSYKQPNIHPQAIYTSQLLNNYTKKISKSKYNLNEFSDDVAILLQFEENSKFNNNKFSDSIAVKELLLQHIIHSD
ncbi:kinase-like domain-containing protein [Glomus cerebriforme]|uniref:Kinase-like domain-containing protein n=1 Tax=Glomus cerebriforme TaxID=658196 RepID=A0A397T2L5_9GLOM|nr:kinase-like domain-containing protein [Glomus cerebriforme]